MPTADYKGIVVYEIIDNGRTLSGVGGNNYSAVPPIYGAMCGDIAIKQQGQCLDTIVGDYTARIMEGDKKEVLEATLNITMTKENFYLFIWKDKDGFLFNGIGLKAGNNHVAVAYSDGDSLMGQKD